MGINDSIRHTIHTSPYAYLPLHLRLPALPLRCPPRPVTLILIDSSVERLSKRAQCCEMETEEEQWHDGNS